MITLWSFFLRGMIERQGMGGMTNIGKSDDRVRVAHDTGVTLKKAAGDDGAKAERRETVDLAGALNGAAEDPARTPPAPDPAGTVARVPAVMPLNRPGFTGGFFVQNLSGFR
jgi:hypothetical protein